MVMSIDTVIDIDSREVPNKKIPKARARAMSSEVLRTNLVLCKCPFKIVCLYNSGSRSKYYQPIDKRNERTVEFSFFRLVKLWPGNEEKKSP